MQPNNNIAPLIQHLIEKILAAWWNYQINKYMSSIYESCRITHKDIVQQNKLMRGETKKN